MIARRLRSLAFVALAACASPAAHAQGVDAIAAGLRALLDDRDTLAAKAALAAQVPALQAQIAAKDVQIADLLDQIARLQPRPEPNSPTLTLGNVTPGPGQRSVLIPVTLSEAPKQTVVVRWGTMNGQGSWSGAGGHYTAASGWLVFQPGETRKTIPVTLLRDLPAGLTVKVAITAKPSGATTAQDGALINGGGTSAVVAPTADAVALPPKPTGKTLAWSQDFAAPGFAMSGAGAKPDGSPAWQSRLAYGMIQDGNKETGLYAPPDVFPSVTMTGLDAAGKRFIQLESHPEGFTDPTTGKAIVRSWDQKPFVYSSAMLQGSKFPAVIKVGSYVEARLKFEMKAGTWPAFWLMPTKGWPPEFDILELFLRTIGQPNIITTTVHYTDTKGNKTGYGTEVPIDAAVPGFDFRDWHTYGVSIERDWFTAYVDDVPVFRVVNPTPIDTLWYPLFDITTGGQVPDADPAQLPAKMGLDWIKVWN